MCHACLCLQVISIDGFARRNRFILAVSLGLGLGVTLVPGWAEVRTEGVGFALMGSEAVIPATDISSEVGTNGRVLLCRTTSGMSPMACPTASAASATLSSWWAIGPSTVHAIAAGLFEYCK